MDKLKRVNYNIAKKNINSLPILFFRVSNKNIYAQLSVNGKIVSDVSSLNSKNLFDDKKKPYNKEGADALGKLCGHVIYPFIKESENNYMNKIKQNPKIKNIEKKILSQYYTLNIGNKRYIGIVKIFDEAVKLGIKEKSNEAK